MAESADAADLKSAGVILVGSSPTPGMSLVYIVTNQLMMFTLHIRT